MKRTLWAVRASGPGWRISIPRAIVVQFGLQDADYIALIPVDVKPGVLSVEVVAVRDGALRTRIEQRPPGSPYRTMRLPRVLMRFVGLEGRKARALWWIAEGRRIMLEVRGVDGVV